MHRVELGGIEGGLLSMEGLVVAESFSQARDYLRGRCTPASVPTRVPDHLGDNSTLGLSSRRWQCGAQLKAAKLAVAECTVTVVPVSRDERTKKMWASVRSQRVRTRGHSSYCRESLVLGRKNTSFGRSPQGVGVVGLPTRYWDACPLIDDD